jgi:cytochrome c oxidase assembly protein subunit 15
MVSWWACRTSRTSSRGHNTHFPARRWTPVARARKCFIRYLAGTLGLLILAIAVTAWRGRGRIGRPPWLAFTLVAVVAVQATLGMWTVTMLLKPAIVTLHLLGGMATLALTLWLALREIDPPVPAATVAARLRPWAAAGLVVLCLPDSARRLGQRQLRGPCCPDFPACHGQWLPAMDFPNAYHVVRELGMTAAGAPLTQEALNAIQWSHRAGAVLTIVLLGGLGLAALRIRALRLTAVVLIGLVGAQAAIGIANVLLRLPLVLAAAHNAGAALLLADARGAKLHRFPQGRVGFECLPVSQVSRLHRGSASSISSPSRASFR